MSEPVYTEKARSYASLWIFATLLAVGFVFDLLLGGGVAHLPGWLIAAALVLGLNWLLLYAVRSEKSLYVDADELRIGDEVIPRADIVAFAAGVDSEELPVLGWPVGMPRHGKGVTIRLAEGQDVVVPTRFPEQLRAALGLEATPSRAQDVRAVARAELAGLAEIADRADTVFRLAGYELPDVPLGDPAKAKAIFVVGRPPIGFVWVDEVDGVAHVAEFAVIPKWMRQGVGTRLLERACEWAQAHGYSAVTLTTYADVPWNGPYYAARGFVEIDELTPGLAACREREADVGLDAVAPRIAMRREL